MVVYSWEHHLKMGHGFHGYVQLPEGNLHQIPTSFPGPSRLLAHSGQESLGVGEAGDPKGLAAAEWS